ncbi:AraC family transcriptional regulator [Priestia aryabhattai]|uniref:AraC family transcriptional regulator n=1 Tax=Priestia aryabhattai TaxID=412384 RepID=UPI0028812837|nr:AraC family transcriptional regulator [Priestia aryabhattai]MDT0145599.1 AraC family transcriptional regulator [Priestia aryabhattai]MDT0151245.1 AraC family transcriptional regulator [Priestia aryabhattai]
MNYPYEQVVVNEDLPAFTLMTTVKYVAKHWHDRIEFLLVLKGTVHVFIGREKYNLCEDDLLLINSNEVHGVEGDGNNKILIVQIPTLFIRKCYKEIDQEKFECKSFLYEDQEQYGKIKSLLSRLYLTMKEKKDHHDLKVHSLLLDIIYQLVSHYKLKNGQQPKPNNRKNIERMSRITEYIQKNYMHPLTLEELAAMEQLTYPYLSRYFQQHMGQTFLKYVNEIRLEHSLRYLIETDLPIIQIAMECGFTNLNTFHKLFKNTFHTTPHQYRKKQSKTVNLSQKKKDMKDYDFIEENDSSHVYKYL